MVIVDPTAWIDYLRGVENPQTPWRDRQLERRRLGLTDFILGEVLQGIRNERDCVHSLIAAFCLHGRHELLHRDRDLDGFEKVLGLKVVHPAP
ncbi:MAG: hypothetical protein ABSF15_09080 [Candidatus Sulfotelmatobacter sp.]|jgi:predicted nucleic acid-binding protein